MVIRSLLNSDNSTHVENADGPITTARDHSGDMRIKLLAIFLHRMGTLIRTARDHCNEMKDETASYIFAQEVNQDSQ
jgi:hypothetical protein